MMQAIAGVSPAVPGDASESSNENTLMVWWASNAAYRIGRWLGKLYAIEAGWYIFRVGNFLALLTSPLGAVIYLYRVAPYVARRYRLTNRRVVIERGLMGVEENAVSHDAYDQIVVEVLPGQAWYDAGDIVFLMQGQEVLRLAGVGRPEPFRRACLSAHQSFVSLRAIFEKQRSTNQSAAATPA